VRRLPHRIPPLLIRADSPSGEVACWNATSIPAKSTGTTHGLPRIPHARLCHQGVERQGLDFQVVKNRSFSTFLVDFVHETPENHRLQHRSSAESSSSWGLHHESHHGQDHFLSAIAAIGSSGGRPGKHQRPRRGTTSRKRIRGGARSVRVGADAFDRRHDDPADGGPNVGLQSIPVDGRSGSPVAVGDCAGGVGLAGGLVRGDGAANVPEEGA